MASTVVKVMTVPSGAFTKPPPSPRLALTWAVKVWLAPTRLVPFGRDLDVGVLEDLGRVAAVGRDRVRRHLKGAEPATDRVASACPVTVPPVADVNVTAKWPAASVVPVNGPAGLAARAVAVGQGHGHRLAGGRDEACAVTRVLVEGHREGVRRVDLVEGVGRDRDPGVHPVLTAGPELPPVPLVVRVSDTPPTVRVVWAVTVDTPVVGDVIVVEHEPVPPAVVHCVGGLELT